jgi:anti-anti-sigma factor
MAEERQLLKCSERGDAIVIIVDAEQLTALEFTDRFDQQLKALVETQSAKTWVIDFQSVTFMVTPAVNTLLNVSKQIEQRGGRVMVTGLNANIRKVFTLMRLDEVIPISPSVEDAIRAAS